MPTLTVTSKAGEWCCCMAYVEQSCCGKLARCGKRMPLPRPGSASAWLRASAKGEAPPPQQAAPCALTNLDGDGRRSVATKAVCYVGGKAVAAVEVWAGHIGERPVGCHHHGAMRGLSVAEDGDWVAVCVGGTLQQPWRCNREGRVLERAVGAVQHYGRDGPGAHCAWQNHRAREQERLAWLDQQLKNVRAWSRSASRARLYTHQCARTYARQSAATGTLALRMHPRQHSNLRPTAAFPPRTVDIDDGLRRRQR